MILTESEVGGMISANCKRNTIIESKMVTPKVSFSPESGGSVKPSNVIDEIITQGIIKLNP